MKQPLDWLWSKIVWVGGLITWLIGGVFIALGKAFKRLWDWKLKSLMESIHGFAKSYHEGLQLVSVVLVAAVTAALAFQANQLAQSNRDVSENQTVLMEQQVSLQAQQSLPVFQVTWVEEKHSGGLVMTEKLILRNTGGLARNASVHPYMYIYYLWESPSSSGGEDGRRVTFPGYLNPETPSFDFFGFDGREKVLGWENNRRNYFSTADLLKQILERDYSLINIRFFPAIWFNVTYTDFMGVERTEWYDVDIYNARQEESDPVNLYPVLNSEGRQRDEDFLNDTQGGLRLPAPMWGENDINVSEVMEVARLMYEDVYGPIPGATPIAHNRDKFLRSLSRSNSAKERASAPF